MKSIIKLCIISCIYFCSFEATAKQSTRRPIIIFIENSIAGHMGYKKQAKKAQSMLDSGEITNDRAKQAYATIGRIFEFGQQGQKIDFDKAYYWYNKCTNMGHSYCQSRLGFVIKKRGGAGADKKAFSLLLKAAKSGQVRAQAQVGGEYYSGKMVQKDLKKAAYWIQKAADTGDIWSLKFIQAWSKRSNAPEYIKKQSKTISKTIEQKGYKSVSKSGAGFFINSNHILTANHVVDGFKIIFITSEADKKSYSAKVIAKDKNTDLAILKVSGITAPQIATLRPENHKTYKLETVFVPSFLKKEFKLKSGMIIDPVIKLSHDALPNSKFNNRIHLSPFLKHGNSGGPIIDSYGGIIGVVREAVLDQGNKDKVKDNFGTTLSDITDFLEENRISFHVTEIDNEKPLSKKEIKDLSKKIAVRIRPLY